MRVREGMRERVRVNEGQRERRKRRRVERERKRGRQREREGRREERRVRKRDRETERARERRLILDQHLDMDIYRGSLCIFQNDLDINKNIVKGRYSIFWG